MADVPILIGVALVLIFWMVVFVYRLERFTQPSGSNKTSVHQPVVAIVTMTREPKDIAYWLNYHMLRGVRYFFIRLETDDKVNDPMITLLNSYPQVHLQIGSPTDKPTIFSAQELSDRTPGQAQMLRQRMWLQDAIRMAFKNDVDWLVHIDTDELLDCAGSVPDAIAADARPNVHTMIIHNVEAVYDEGVMTDATKGCFTFKRIRDCAQETCASYGNGKSVGRVSPLLREAGVHRFRYVGTEPAAEVEMRSLRVIHFESCNFPAYVDKFQKLASSEISKFPFPYYNDSIAVARSPVCRTQQPACMDKFKQVFRRYRT